ncbi:MAG: OsmC family protein [Gammaproteobacteria bacterium]|jgi:organic hydroperoxide reductase OsmC/OhrA
MSDIPLHYHSAYQWTGEEMAGEASIEGQPPLPVGSPHSPGRYSPEHLLVVAAETCLANYVLLLAGLSSIEVKDYRSTAEGELMQEGAAGYRFRRILIRPRVSVAAGNEVQAQRLLQKAHTLCLVARSLNCPVEMEASVEAA